MQAKRGEVSGLSENDLSDDCKQLVLRLQITSVTFAIY